jgi:hypothetical protein
MVVILDGCKFCINCTLLLCHFFQADQRVLRLLIDKHIPEIGKIFREQDIEIGLITLNWFLTIFASVLPMHILVRVWDVVFYEGTVALFRVCWTI